VDPGRQQVEIYRLDEDPDRPAVVAHESFEWQPVPGAPTLLITISDFMRGFA
jgi:hypothetical protein